MHFSTKGFVVASKSTEDLAVKLGFEVLDLNYTGALDFYVDGADEILLNGVCLKGGGGAMTMEKIIAANSAEFIAIVDESKNSKNTG